jgi:hypothetical protein
MLVRQRKRVANHNLLDSQGFMSIQCTKIPL